MSTQDRKRLVPSRTLREQAGKNYFPAMVALPEPDQKCFWFGLSGKLLHRITSTTPSGGKPLVRTVVNRDHGYCTVMIVVKSLLGYVERELGGRFEQVNSTQEDKKKEKEASHG